MLKDIKGWISSITEIGVALLALAIVVSMLVGTGNMFGLGNVVGNIIALVQQLSNAGLAGLIALGVVIWLFKMK